MAIAASAPVLPNQKKQCCKIALFTDAPCILFWNSISNPIYVVSFMSLLRYVQAIVLLLPVLFCLECLMNTSMSSAILGASNNMKDLITSN